MDGERPFNLRMKFVAFDVDFSILSFDL